MISAPRKDDAGKLRFDLIPPRALERVVAVLTYGATKYGDENWRAVMQLPNGPDRYFAASQRHTWARKRGEVFDPDSGLYHLACSATSQLFLLEEEMEEIGG